MTDPTLHAAHFDDLPQRLSQLPVPTLQAMQQSAQKIQHCYKLLKKHEQYGNVVREVLRDQGKFYELDHYPKGDVHDSESHSQYFYHAHRGIDGENGHFHTFMRAKGMPEAVEPVEYKGEVQWPEGDDALSHLIAISMDPKGYPIGLFSTNRWVTGENWYSAEDVISMLDNFNMDLIYPSLPLNIWLTETVRLFRPQIEQLLIERDAAIENWKAKHPDKDVFEDRDLEVTSSLLIDVDTQLETVTQELQGRTH